MQKNWTMRHFHVQLSEGAIIKPEKKNVSSVLHVELMQEKLSNVLQVSLQRMKFFSSKTESTLSAL
jgi:hypothetical protein